MSQPLLVTGTIGIDTILTPSGRADGVLGGAVSLSPGAGPFGPGGEKPPWKPPFPARRIKW